MLKALIAAPLLLAMAACVSPTAPAPSAGRDCFAARSIQGYSVIDDHHVQVSITPSRAYILGTTWNARDLDWGQHIALRSRPSDWICTGNGIGVEVTGGDPRRTYPITEITRAPPPPAQGS